MAIDKPVAVPKKEIGSVDIPNFAAGLFLNGPQNAPINAIVENKDTELDLYGYLIPRRKLAPFLPDTIEACYQKFPVLWNGTIYHFVADANKIYFCEEGDTGWTECGGAKTTAALTTALTGANNDLTFTAVAAGLSGNSINIIYLDPGVHSATLSVSVAGTTITVHLATNGAGNITSTGSTVLAAILASGAATALVSAALAVGNTGAAVVTAMASTPLTGGTAVNSITTNNGGKPIFLRVLNAVVLLNGDNGDKICYVDLNTGGFPVVKFTAIADPTTVLTGALTNLTSGTNNIYYAYSYSSAVGETLLNTILTESINLPRSQWQNNTASPSSIKVSRPAGSPPAGATFWNLYMAVSATGGTIQASDMLQVATGLDLANHDFVDDGTLSINLGGPAPIDNSTDGFRVSHGIVEDGNPILYGDADNPYNIWIGGAGLDALKFTPSNNGYLAQPEMGTNFYPTQVIGFRNGQGVPSLTVLYSNTEGLSKQAVLQQQTVNYGDQSFTVWGTTEQHYGAAGVAAPNSVINYNGALRFLSTDGFLNMSTQPSVQNVLSTSPLSTPIDPYVRQIKNSAMANVVGAGWNNKFMWLVPNAGFDTPQQIIICDDNNKGAWYTLDIPAQWIGVVSPQNDAAFVYISQGIHTYKLLQASSTFDTIDGASVPFSTGARGALIGMGGKVHNIWQADVQVMFNVLGLVGNMTIGVTYRNQNQKLKTKTKVITGPSYTPSSAGGWGDPGWAYANVASPGYSSEPAIDDTVVAVTAVDVRKAIQIDDIFNEAQWFYFTDAGFNNYKFKAVSFEGINLGVRPDLQ